MSVIDRISAVVEGATRSTKGNTIARCPVHDDKNRSFTYKEEGETLLLKCWAGCSFQQLLDELVRRGAVEPRRKAQENVKDNYPLKFHHPEVGEFQAEFDSPNYSLVAVYKYREMDGTLVGFKARFKPKTFRHFTHCGFNKNYAKRLKPLPYRLPEVLKSISQGAAIHCFEGEKDVENALAMGFEEATSFGCATDPLPLDYIPKFKGSDWVIWADNDKPGLKRAPEIALQLHRAGCRVKVVIPPIGKDFSDWKEAGATIDDIAKFLEETPVWRPEVEQIAALAQEGTLPATEYELGSDAFAGALLAHKFRRELRFAPNFGTWMTYDGKAWGIDKVGDHHEKVKALSRLIKLDMQKLGHIERQSLAKLATRLQSDSGRKAVVSTARTEQSLRIDTMLLDGRAVRHLLACESGIIDLRQCNLLSHSSEHLITKCSPYAVDMDNEPHMFLEFINRMFDDEEVVEWMLNFLGYCLTGETGFQKFSMWVGMAGTGKSQLQVVMRGLLGSHCGDLDASTLVAAKQRTAAVDSDLAGVRGCRLVFASELSSDHKLDERTIKALSGEDVIKVKFMGQDKFPLQAHAKLIFTANARPPLSDDAGIARRLIEVRFEKPPEREIEYYGEKMLAAEGPQILGYLARRARRYYANPEALKLPKQIEEWTRDYIDEVDYIKQWKTARLEFVSGCFTTNRALMEDLEAFCKANYIPLELTQNMLSRRLIRFGFKPDRDEKQRGWRNVMLRG